MAHEQRTESPLLLPHEVMALVFDTPRKRAALARRMGVSDNHVDKWCRDGGTGAASDIDRVVKVMQCASDVGTASDVALISGCVHTHSIAIQNAGAAGYGSEHERVMDSAAILREATEAVDAMMTGKPTPATLKELVELRDKAEAAITRLSAPPQGVRP